MADRFTGDKQQKQEEEDINRKRKLDAKTKSNAEQQNWDDSRLQQELKDVGISAKSLKHLNLPHPPVFVKRFKTDILDVTMMTTCHGPLIYLHKPPVLYPSITKEEDQESSREVLNDDKNVEDKVLISASSDDQNNKGMEKEVAIDDDDKGMESKVLINNDKGIEQKI